MYVVRKNETNKNTKNRQAYDFRPVCDDFDRVGKRVRLRDVAQPTV